MSAKRYEYMEGRRLDFQHREMNRMGAEGWKLIDVRHDRTEPSWADELLFMRELPPSPPSGWPVGWIVKLMTPDSKQ